MSSDMQKAGFLLFQKENRIFLL